MRLVEKGRVPRKDKPASPNQRVTKLNPLMDEQNKLGSSSVEQGEAGGEAELPTQTVCGGDVGCKEW